jgi:hypothetical protein
MSTDTSTYRRSMETPQPEEARSEPVDPLPKDETFHLLSNRRRRDALRYLADHDGPVDMRDLAEQVAAWEQETTVQQLSSQERQRVYIALYQTHLPKLDDYGVITYDQSRGFIERTERARQLEPYLRDADDTGPADSEPAVPRPHVFGLCAAGLLVLVVGWLELVPAFALLAATWTALVLLVLVRPELGSRRVPAA